ncbi:hypothetical protein J6590_104805, partial [Homalodisca vitripennis]
VTMVRNYIKKKVGPEINERDVEEAVKLVLEKKRPNTSSSRIVWLGSYHVILSNKKSKGSSKDKFTI